MWISADAQVVTQIAEYSAHGTVALAAHQGLAGASFDELTIGQELRVVYGDGRVSRYEISLIKQYQVLSPEDPSQTTFTDLGTGTIYPWTDLYTMYFQDNNNLVLATCLPKDDNGSWGRTFITAVLQP